MSSLDDLVPIALRACVLLSFISLFPGTAYAANPAAGNAPPVTPAVAPAASPTLAPVPAPLADTPAVAPTAETSSEVVDDDLATQPVSHAARTRLERARDSVVQIRGFFGESQSDAFHGSGFAATADGLIVTNYHVVSDAVLYPKQYRLEYLAHDGRSGKLRIHAIDIENDLAVVRGDNFDPPALTLRTQIPNKGDRAYSIGFPLNLGLTITEGVANGLVDGALEQRIHYSGAMNSGMSGGPALDSAGAVYGVNVSVLTRGQSVSFVVPAKHIKPLLARAQKPLPTSDAREQVAAQLYAHQAAVFAAIPTKLATYVSAGYTLPAKIAPAFECNSSSNAEANRPLRIETMNCSAPVGVYVQRGLDTGDIQIFHRVLRSERLHALQFAARLNRSAASFYWSGSPQHVAPFACTNEIVALHGFDARVSICVRQYRMFAELYDIAVSIVSLNQLQRAIVSDVRMRGVAFDSGMDFLRRHLGAMRWSP